VKNPEQLWELLRLEPACLLGRDEHNNTLLHLLIDQVRCFNDTRNSVINLQRNATQHTRGGREWSRWSSRLRSTLDG
jgi:hypothetical protein